MSIFGKFYIRPAAGELVNAELSPGEDPRVILCGRLSDGEGRAVPDAAVLLYLDDMELPALIARTVTDEDGQFLFGPLECGPLYVVKVFKNGLRERQLDLRTV